MNRLVERVTKRPRAGEAFWNSLLTGIEPGATIYRMRRSFAIIRAEQRCEVRRVPFDGVGMLPFGVM